MWYALNQFPINNFYRTALLFRQGSHELCAILLSVVVSLILEQEGGEWHGINYCLCNLRCGQHYCKFYLPVAEPQMRAAAKRHYR